MSKKLQTSKVKQKRRCNSNPSPKICPTADGEAGQEVGGSGAVPPIYILRMAAAGGGISGKYCK